VIATKVVSVYHCRLTKTKSLLHLRLCRVLASTRLTRDKDNERMRLCDQTGKMLGLDLLSKDSLQLRLSQNYGLCNQNNLAGCGEALA
jgi:hypothetical protein